MHPSSRKDSVQAFSTDYPYAQLDETKKEVRLLLLHGRKQQNDWPLQTLRCSLSRVPINEAPPFEALSYVWGEVSNVSMILLDEKPYPTAPNLFTALMRLQKDEDRCLWVDALCINQADYKERSSQVAMMRSIYERAFSVVVYLSEMTQGHNIAMDFMELAGRNETLHWNPTIEPHITCHEMDTSSQTLQGHISAFLSVPWVSRLWTVQEYCVAKKVLFQCGHRIIHDDVVQACFNNHHIHRITCCGEMQDFSSIRGDSYSLSTCISTLRMLAIYRQTKDPRYLSTISDFRYRHCLDPRDKIYGILGLLQPHPRSQIIPDYTCTPMELYIQIALAHITTTKSLDILSLVYGEKTQDLSIPSCVPDWTTHVDFSQHAALGIRERNIKCYNASAGSTVSLQHNARGEIRLSGMLVDTIAEIVDVSNLVPKLRACRNVAGFNVNTNSAYTSKLTAFWQTMCGGLIWAGTSDEYTLRKICPSDIHQYHRWLETIDSDGRPDLTNKDVATFHLSHNMVTALRKFVVTAKGFMGWAPKNARRGDSVVLFGGGRLPYVLRPVKAGDTSSGESRSFVFVGDAYINGVMEGELYNSRLTRDFHLV